jgi:hypothetical protein
MMDHKLEEDITKELGIRIINTMIKTIKRKCSK